MNPARPRDAEDEALDVLGVGHHAAEREAGVGTAGVDHVEKDTVEREV